MRSFYTPLSVIESLSQSQGDSPAIRHAKSESTNDEFETISYATHWQNINIGAKKWITELSKAGITKGAVVGLWMRGWSYGDLLHYLSLQRAGFIPQLFSIRMTDPSIVYDLLGNSNAAALLYDPVCELLVKECRIPKFSTGTILGRYRPADVQLGTATSTDGDKVLVIFHTSGSTSGMPKLVPQTVRWMDCLIRKHRDINYKPGSVASFMGSYTHLGNTINLSATLASGGCLIPPTSVPYPTSELEHMISKGGLTILNTFPVLLSGMLQEARQSGPLLKALRSLDRINFAGQVLEPRDEAWAHQNGLKLINLYGSTEIGLSMVSSSTSPHLSPLPESGCQFVPLGESSSSPNQLLELIVPAKADDCPHISLRNKSDGMFSTGDLFEQVDVGQYVYKGRVDDRIKMQLALVCDAGSLESEAMQVCEDDLISAVSVIGSGRPSPAMVVEAKNDDILQADEDGLSALKRQIVQRIARFHQRKYAHERIDDVRLVFVAAKGSLPRTAKGNIMRKAVEEMFATELDRSYHAVHVSEVA
ncbi:4-hydroxybenzoate-- benzoate-- ligase [Fusarium sporotrichioides]|uniref:4-hydroxybenzoate--benzoate--ligase n=1 Tax=Fusarium sporotrichioides TaxID=5514 RepID=A0A395SMN6_FUSSP|nr:4-hydroxybenzoate-- benzoate-- ligase [Fusarium sporotrichioides]